MTHLLAILISLAMLLTGASTAALPEEPVGRTVTIGNLQVTHNEDSVALSPYAVLSVATDGVRAIYDFVLNSDDDAFFPFQAVVEGDTLLARLDNDGRTLKLTEAELTDMLGLSADDEQLQMMEAYFSDVLPAMSDMMALMRDPERMQAVRDRGWEIYDEMVDRGEPKPGKVEYEGEIYDADNYEYTLDSAQIGAFTDAVLDSDDTLRAYKDAYFKMISQLPEDTGFAGATSYSEILAKVDMTMNMFESMTDNGLDIMDGRLTIDMEQMEKPLTMRLHQSRFEDVEFSTVSYDLELEAMILEVYMENSRDGMDNHFTATVTGNPPAEPGSDGEGDGEGDGEDMLYITLDFDVSLDEDTGVTQREGSMTIDSAQTGLHVDASIEGEHDAEGVGACSVVCNYSDDLDSGDISFDVVTTDEAVEARVTDEDATPVNGAMDLTPLLASLGQDAQRLSQNEDVAALIEMFTPAAPEEIPAEAGAEAPEAGTLSFEIPTFDWLPEGYAIDEIDPDAEYDEVTCTMSNAETGDVITVDITNSENVDAVNQYVIKDDSFGPVDGLLVTEEVYDDYCVYYADNGQINVTVYPDSRDVPADDILNIIIGMHM